jgi:hypothetical protein
MGKQLVNTRKRKGLPLSKTQFQVWVENAHPEINLYPWQIEVANNLLSQPRGMGKTTLIKLLAEFDQPGSVPSAWRAARVSTAK